MVSLFHQDERDIANSVMVSLFHQDDTRDILNTVMVSLLITIY